MSPARSSTPRTPRQGEWSEEDYLCRTDGTNERVEFTDGRLEFLPMPTEVHQELMMFFYHALYQLVMTNGLGKVHVSGLRLRVRPRKIRQPDVIFLHKDHFHARHNRVWDGADLVMEVVSEDAKDRQRDYETKVLDYAEARVPEYWIIDPQERAVIVHSLRGESYAIHGRFAVGEVATSPLLPEFAIDVGELFAVLDDIPE